MKISRNIAPKLLVFLLGITGIVVAQKALWIENRSIAVEHCRKMNLQNIFFYNQLIVENQQQPLSESVFLLPKYCERHLEAKQKEEILKLSTGSISLPEAGALVRLYADFLAETESRDSQTQRALLLAFVVINMIILAIETMLLRSRR